jgi:hypothetical protein
MAGGIAFANHGAHHDDSSKNEGFTVDMARRERLDTAQLSRRRDVRGKREIYVKIESAQFLRVRPNHE